MFAVSIDDAAARQQTFGEVTDAFIRVVDAANNTEMARYDLTEDSSTDTAMLFGEFSKDDSGWNFRALGQSHAGGLGASLPSSE